MQGKFIGEMVRQYRALRPMLPRKPNSGAVIALKCETGGRWEISGNRPDVRGKFRMFEEKRNERQAQTRIVTFGKGGDQADRLFVQGGISAFPPAHQKKDVEGAQGIRELVACDCG